MPSVTFKLYVLKFKFQATSGNFEVSKSAVLVYGTNYQKRENVSCYALQVMMDGESAKLKSAQLKRRKG